MAAWRSRAWSYVLAALGLSCFFAGLAVGATPGGLPGAPFSPASDAGVATGIGLVVAALVIALAEPRAAQRS